MRKQELVPAGPDMIRHVIRHVSQGRKSGASKLCSMHGMIVPSGSCRSHGHAIDASIRERTHATRYPVRQSIELGAAS